MASVQLPQKKGSKSLDADINLVPFVDFLSICICFLLMTAVWVEVAQLNVKQAMGTAEGGASVTENEIEISFEKTDQLIVKFKTPKKKSPLRISTVDHKSFVEQIRLIVKDQSIQVGTIVTSSKVNHGAVVKIMDALRNAGIGKLGVNHGV